MTRIFHLAAGTLVLSGLIVGSLIAHKDHVRQIQIHNQNVAQHIQNIRTVDAANLSAVQKRLDVVQAQNAQLTNTQTALCGFIRQYSIRTATIPSACR